MTHGDKKAEFLTVLGLSLDRSHFVKLSLGNYKGGEADLKSIIVKKVSIKREGKLSFTYRYKTRDIVKNYDVTDGLNRIAEALADFHAATLLTTQADFILERRKDKYFLKQSAPTNKAPADTSHDRAKNRMIDAKDKQYLHHLKITDAKGDVYKNAQDKFRQINKYVEILAPLLPEKDNLSIADMGSGKGYLTFALYDYIAAQGRAANVTGVEYRQDMVDLCNDIAHKCNYSGLSFVQGKIEEYQTPMLDVLIALHACDTATDDAIAKGVQAGAALIVVAPCCHKQIRREMEKAGPPDELAFLLKHGTFLERQAEMTTDAMRCLLLEQAGYATKAFEFIMGEHTPKNVMIVAAKTKKTDAQKAKARAAFEDAKSFFGIGTHYLERTLFKN